MKLQEQFVIVDAHDGDEIKRVATLAEAETYLREKNIPGDLMCDVEYEIKRVFTTKDLPKHK